MLTVSVFLEVSELLRREFTLLIAHGRQRLGLRRRLAGIGINMAKIEEAVHLGYAWESANLGKP